MNSFLVAGLKNTVILFDSCRPIQIVFGDQDVFLLNGMPGLTFEDIKNIATKDLEHCGWQEVEIGTVFNNGTSWVAYISASNFEPDELSVKEKELCGAIDTLEAEILKRDEAIKQIMKKLLIHQ